MASVNPAGGRHTIGSYPSYEEAERAVDFLSDQGFGVQHVAIVGEGLRYVENVVGRKGYGQAAVAGAASGAMIGALLGVFFGLFSFFDPVRSALIAGLFGVVIGAVAGAVLGMLSHALSGGRRDFSAVGAVSASRYDVVVDASVAEEARGLLEGMPARR